jgi:hypothetical protein
MKRLCISDGDILRRILASEVSSLELEEWFNRAAEVIANKPRLHYNTATQLGWAFTPAQRQLLAYLFWEIFRVEWQRQRGERAHSIWARAYINPLGTPDGKRLDEFD